MRGEGGKKTTGSNEVPAGLPMAMHHVVPCIITAMHNEVPAG